MVGGATVGGIAVRHALHDKAAAGCGSTMSPNDDLVGVRHVHAPQSNQLFHVNDDVKTIIRMIRPIYFVTAKFFLLHPVAVPRPPHELTQIHRNAQFLQHTRSVQDLLK